MSRRSKQTFLQRRRAAAAAKSLQSCLTLCDPIDGSPPGSFIPGILQARTLEWVAISFSNAWKWKVKSCLTQRPHGLQPTRLLCPWDFPGKSTGVGCHCLLRKKTYKWLINTWKDAQHCSLLEKCKSKPQWGVISHQSEWPSSKTLQTINVEEGVEKREPSYSVDGSANWYNHFGQWSGDSLKN